MNGAEGVAVLVRDREAFLNLAERSLVPRNLADRLARSAGLGNLIAHRYGVLDMELCRCLADADERTRAP